MKSFIFIAIILISLQGRSQIFTESIGTVASTTTIAVHEGANGFDNDPFTMTGTGDIRITSPSAGYIGATGLANVLLTNSIGTNFQIAGIITTTCSSLSLSFGAFKSTTASNMSELILEYSTDGVAYTSVAIPAQPTGSGTANWRLITVSLPVGAENQANLRLRWRNSSATPQFRLDDITLNGTCGSPTTITPGAITGAPFTVDCSTPASGSIAFTSSGTFLVGNAFTAQLSNVAGNFTSPITLQSISGASAEGVNPSGNISFDIPAGTLSGVVYRIRIISSSPVATSSNSSTFSITLTGGPCVLEPPHLTSVIINSCDGLCTEGNNEIVFGTSGNYSFNVNTTNFDFLYGTSSPGTNYTDVLLNNATRINELNLAAGCGSLFIDASSGNVPVNANWMLVSTAICTEALTWSGLCGSGPIYVIFQNDANWQTSGNFANNPSTPATRYYRTSITTTSGSTFTIDYTTDGSYPNSDGVYGTFDSNGGPATLYADNNCILTPAVLPIGLTYFKGDYTNSVSNLYWQTASEQNNSHFTLSHSTDGYQFSTIGTVMGAGNSFELSDYRFIHNFPHPGINYYKLKSTDYDGKEYEKGIVAIEAEFNFSFYNSATSTIELTYDSDIEIFSTDGKLIQTALNSSSIPFSKTGLFFIYDKKTGISERLFVP